MNSSIGQLGLGNAGYCYAKNLIKAGKTVIAYDPAPERIEAANKLGVVVAGSPSEIGERCDEIILSLPNPDTVGQALLGPTGLIAQCRENALIIDISTIDEGTALEIERQAKARNVGYLEAPMSGGEPGGAGTFGADAATITFMCGGDEVAFQRAQVILKLIGKHSFLLGPVGSGNKIKLISNLIAGINMAAMAEGFVLGKAAGFDFKTLFEVFKHTDAKSYTMFEEFLPHLESGDYSYGFPIELMHKDHRLAGEMARKLQVPLFLNQLVQELYQSAMVKGLGRESHAAIVKQLADISGVPLEVSGGARRRDALLEMTQV